MILQIYGIKIKRPNNLTVFLKATIINNVLAATRPSQHLIQRELLGEDFVTFVVEFEGVFAFLVERLCGIAPSAEPYALVVFANLYLEGSVVGVAVRRC